MKDIYQTISFLLGEITSDVRERKVDLGVLQDAKNKFLDRLAEEGFEVLVDHSRMINGFPPQIIIGGERSSFKQRVVEIAAETGLSGHYFRTTGPFYMIHKT